MTFELTVLGSSSALPTSTKFPSAHVLNIHERFFLIDCGEGTQIQLRRAKIRFGKLNHIFISHIHGDHVFGLFGILSTFQLLGRKTPLHLYGHSSLEQIIEFYLKHFSNDEGYPIKMHKISQRQSHVIYEDTIVRVQAFPLKHRVPTFGFLFQEKKRPPNIRKDAIAKYNFSIKQINDIKDGKDIELESGELLANTSLTELPYKSRTYAYCSDTQVYEKNIPLLKDIDLLYHEATFLDRDKKLAKLTGHSTARQAAEFAFKANTGKLLIGHFSSRYKELETVLQEARAVFPNTESAEELKTYRIPLERIKPG
jgi:ribonuclease Z